MELQINFSFKDKGKKCTGCGEEKELSEFHKNCTKHDGLQEKCKACRSAWAAGYYLANREKKLKQGREYKKNNREAIQKHDKEYKQSPEGKFSRYKGRAKKKGYKFELDFELFKSLSLATCYHCGGEGYGIDRLNSSEGYTVSNSVPCCTLCNMSKRHHDEEVWLQHIVKIIEHKGLM